LSTPWFKKAASPFPVGESAFGAHRRPGALGPFVIARCGRTRPAGEGHFSRAGASPALPLANTLTIDSASRAAALFEKSRSTPSYFTVPSP